MWDLTTGLMMPGKEYRRALAMDRASKLYRRARSRAHRGQHWSLLTGHPRRLLELSAVQASCRIRSQHYAGLQAVPVRCIRGSEGRSQDFDAEFRPLQGHTRARWVGIAAAQELEVALPPVQLIQIGGIYFARDGHHRISVAWAMGQEIIEAEVTVWEVFGPLPWEQTSVSDRPMSLVGNLACQLV